MEGYGIVCIPVASPLHNPKLVDPILDRIRAKISGYVDYTYDKITDLSSVDLSKLKSTSGLVLIVLTGGTEELISSLIGSVGKPAVLVAHNSQNSLAASLEAISLLRAEGYYVGLVLESEVERVKYFSKAVKALSTIRGLKVISIGKPSPWLIYSISQEAQLKRDFGFKVEYVDLGEVLKVKSEIPSSEIVKTKRDWRLDRVVKGVNERDLDEALRLYLALKEITKKYNGRVLTIRCFDLLRYGVTACLALSILNSEGIIVGCEGDIPATISMAILSSIANRPSFMGNIVWVSGDRVLFAHCTIALSMVSRFTLRTHFESGLSVAIEGYPKCGEVVTFAKIDSRRRVILVGRGVVLNDKPLRSDNCRTQILVRVLGNARELVEDPVGNHVALTYGDHTEAIRYLAEMVGYKLKVV